MSACSAVIFTFKPFIKTALKHKSHFTTDEASNNQELTNVTIILLLKEKERNKHHIYYNECAVVSKTYSNTINQVSSSDRTRVVTKTGIFSGCRAIVFRVEALQNEYKNGGGETAKYPLELN